MKKTNIFNCDCMKILPKLEDNSIDVFILDLPYGQTSCSWDIKIDLKEMWKHIKRLRKNKKTPIIFFCTTRFGYELINSNKEWFRYDLILTKSRAVGFLNCKKMPMRSHEMIYVFSEESSYYYPLKFGSKKINRKNSSKKSGGIYGCLKKGEYEVELVGKYSTSVLYTNISNNNNFHPTQKPLSILEYLVCSYSKENDVICDFTMGCGSTGIAALLNNRRFIGVEMDRKYYNIAKNNLMIAECGDVPKNTTIYNRLELSIDGDISGISKL